MKSAIVSLAVSAPLAIALHGAALAAPVTEADLSGKKICWANGAISDFHADGTFSGNSAGQGAWAIRPEGVQVTIQHSSSVAAIDKLPDGTFKGSFANRVGARIETTGALCK
jgi:hypothetical protein